MDAVAGCTWHPERAAIGVCVDCRRVVCGDCATAVDGIQRCAPCMAALAAPDDPPPAGDDVALGRAGAKAQVAAVLASWFGLLLMIWAVLEVVRSIR